MSVEEFEKDQSPGPHLLEDSFYNSASSTWPNSIFISNLDFVKKIMLLLSMKDLIHIFFIFSFSLQRSSSRRHSSQLRQRFGHHLGFRCDATRRGFHCLSAQNTTLYSLVGTQQLIHSLRWREIIFIFFTASPPSSSVHQIKFKQFQRDI